MDEDVAIFHPSGTPCDWMESKATVRPLSELSEQQYDAVIFNNPPDYKHVRRVKATLKIFYILGLYDKDKLKKFNPKIFWPIKGRMLSLKRALQMPFLMISNASWMQQYLKENLGIDSELLIGGINRKIFYPVDVGRDPDVINILASGDTREFKGTQTVIEAVAILKKEFPNVVLEFYYGKNIPQSKMAGTYSSADVFLDATWDTGSGWNNPVCEAMACKVPVVCTDIGGVQDFAKHRKTALVVAPKNPVRMAEAAAEIIRSEHLRESLRQNAYDHVLQFDWGVAAMRLRELLMHHIAA
ncbi:MAG: glycosyltransferase family 4 protein [Gammaproteobacteria bacterium]|nr:glycosyltransferase family 4 protein [Gammaproteobacteria bacterium]